MIIYKITNLIDQKIYIGLTTRTIDERFKEHKNDAFGRYKKSYLHNAIRKHGIDNFKIEIIDTADNELELNEKEIYWINFYNSNNKNIGYNNKEGGLKGKHLPEAIEKIKEAGRNREFKESTREKLRKNIPPNHTGKKRSEETKKKMSDAQKGRKQPEHVIEALRQSNIGKKQSQEQIEKRILKIRGRKKPEGQMEKLRLKNIGSKRSEESKQKMRESALKRHNKIKEEKQ